MLVWKSLKSNKLFGLNLIYSHTGPNYLPAYAEGVRAGKIINNNHSTAQNLPQIQLMKATALTSMLPSNYWLFEKVAFFSNYTVIVGGWFLTNFVECTRTFFDNIIFW